MSPNIHEWDALGESLTEHMPINIPEDHECTDDWEWSSMCCGFGPVEDDVWFCGRCQDTSGWICSICEKEKPEDV